MSMTDDSKSAVDLPDKPLDIVPVSQGANPGKPDAQPAPISKQAGTGKPAAATAKAARASAPAQRSQTVNSKSPNSRSTRNTPSPQHANAKPPASGQPADTPDEVPGEDIAEALGGWLSTVPAWLVSMVFHIALLLLLALLTFRVQSETNREITLDSHEIDRLESTEDQAPPMEQPEDSDELQPLTFEQPVADDMPTPVQFDRLELAASNIPLPDLETDFSARFDPAANTTAFMGDALMSRSTGARDVLLRQGGGTPESERAVALALEWLARHQYQDGSWSFNHGNARGCNGKCTAPGNLGTRSPDSPNAATALGLLPFLGAGFTHTEGKYKGVVEKGLIYLIQHQKSDGSWHEGQGTMYSHGLCAIAVCEAYAMTEDSELREPAQNAIKFIEYFQDKNGGGWRYRPGQTGDTSVVGWQIMALKSAQMSYLAVDPDTILRAERFLDSVQRESGSVYGYLQPDAGKTTTAVGLLCRMYMGWKEDHPALARGVEYLSRSAPDTDTNDVYYNYYATQVLRHFDGPKWKAWNDVLREHLIATQLMDGHARGSWYSEGAYNKIGGRHYTTAMSAMILEVYYRHMPLYRKEAGVGFDVGDAFKPGADDAGNGDGANDGANQNDGDVDDGDKNNADMNNGDATGGTVQGGDMDDADGAGGDNRIP